MELSDHDLGVLLLGVIGGLMEMPAFPINIRDVSGHRGEDGQVDWIIVETKSGLRYKVNIELLRGG